MLKKRKKFKTNNRERCTPQKRKANNSGGKDWKTKFRKAIKTDQGLKSIMSIMATEERTNQVFVSALVTSNS